MLYVGPRFSTANFASRFLCMKGRRERGGRRISETKEVTTVVNAAAMLICCEIFDGVKGEGEEGDVH